MRHEMEFEWETPDVESLELKQLVEEFTFGCFTF